VEEMLLRAGATVEDVTFELETKIVVHDREVSDLPPFPNTVRLRPSWCLKWNRASSLLRRPSLNRSSRAQRLYDGAELLSRGELAQGVGGQLVIATAQAL
jgi:hypothetical protein